MNNMTKEEKVLLNKLIKELDNLEPKQQIKALIDSRAKSESLIKHFTTNDIVFHKIKSRLKIVEAAFCHYCYEKK